LPIKLLAVIALRCAPSCCFRKKRNLRLHRADATAGFTICTLTAGVEKIFHRTFASAFLAMCRALMARRCERQRSRRPEHAGDARIVFQTIRSTLRCGAADRAGADNGRPSALKAMRDARAAGR